MKRQTPDELLTRIATRRDQIVDDETRRRRRSREQAHVRGTASTESQPDQDLIAGEKRVRRIQQRRSRARHEIQQFLSAIGTLEGVEIFRRGRQLNRDTFAMDRYSSDPWDDWNDEDVTIEVRFEGRLIVQEQITSLRVNAPGPSLGIQITPHVGPGADRPRKLSGFKSIVEYLQGPFTEWLVEAVSYAQAEKTIRRKEIDDALARRRGKPTV